MERGRVEAHSAYTIDSQISMKKSEMKKKILTSRQTELPPQTYTQLTCPSIKYSKSGCQACWYCEECGRGGCHNFYFARPGIDKIEVVKCDLEDG